MIHYAHVVILSHLIESRPALWVALWVTDGPTVSRRESARAAREIALLKALSFEECATAWEVVLRDSGVGTLPHFIESRAQRGSPLAPARNLQRLRRPQMRERE